MNSNNSLLSKNLLGNLNPKDWPIRIADLPPGSALVGGSVRDGLLNQLSQKPDLDFILPINATEFTKNLATKVQGTLIKLDQHRDIARLAVNGWTLDFARQVGGNLKADLFRRDFRINAIALMLNKDSEIFDPTGGIDDLINKKIVAISEKNLIDDPLRILRGLRLMCELDFALERKTKSFFKDHSHKLNLVAPERIKTEVLKIVNSDWSESFWKTFLELNLLKNWQEDKLPFYSHESFFNNIKDELLIGRPLARLICLLSNEGLSQLTFSKNQIKISQKLRFWVCKINKSGLDNLSEDERFQLHIDLADDLPSFLFFLNESRMCQWLERWRDLSDPLFHPSSPLDGLALQEAFGIVPGPALGDLMRHLSKERAFGRLFTKKEAYEVASDWILQN